MCFKGMYGGPQERSNQNSGNGVKTTFGKFNSSNKMDSQRIKNLKTQKTGMMKNPNNVA